VPNMPAIVARTASYGLNNSVLDYFHQVADNGLTHALMGDEGLGKGVCTYNGFCTNESIAESFEVDFKKLHIFSTN
ncbi:MAG TPA: alanine dehydrogenase, partial [Ignavibacteriaceae bacterium]